jgi:hypothetical protein
MPSTARTVLLATLLVAPLASCGRRPTCCPTTPRPPASVVRAPVVVQTPAPRSGGLLGDTRDFRPNPERPGRWVWTKPGVDLRAYDDLSIEEVRAQPAPGSGFAALPPADQAAAARALRDALVRTVAPYYDVVETAGAHTLGVRVALTSVPDAHGTGAASLEAELLDAKTGERLVAVLGSLTEAELRSAAADEALAPAERANRAWAARLLHYLDQNVR